MEWSESYRADIDLALNESEVVGIRLGSGSEWCDVLLHVVALDEDGAIDRDPRRILRLHNPSRIDVLLRRDRLGSGLGPPIPLEDLAAVEGFFASLTASDPMYGWRFFDYEGGTENWPSEPSLSGDARWGKFTSYVLVVQRVRTGPRRGRRPVLHRGSHVLRTTGCAPSRWIPTPGPEVRRRC